MIRPELEAFLYRWRETVVFGIASILSGGSVVFLGNLSLQILSGILSLVFAVLSYLGWRRASLSGAHGGEGVVEVTERAITYYGPSEGWELSLEALDIVALTSDEAVSPTSDYYWVFQANDGGFYTVPAAALGAQNLSEKLAFLPGIDLDLAARVARNNDHGVFTVWRRDAEPALSAPARSV